MNDSAETLTPGRDYFQNHMGPNVCYGCGKDNDKGLQIQSYWDGDEAICEWQSKEHHHGWPTIMNGGIMATLIDCHRCVLRWLMLTKMKGDLWIHSLFIDTQLVA